MTRRTHIWLLLAVVLALGLGGCGDDDASTNGDAATADDGAAATDGSTTPDAGTTPDGGVVDSGVDCTNAYFVAPDGVAGNPGTIDEPFATVQEAHDNPALGPGDVICLRGGTYYPTDRTRFRKAGTASDYIVIGAYPGELPVINGRDIPEGDTNGGSTVTWAFSDAQYWKVQGPIHITNGRGAGVYIEDSQFIELHLVESSYNGKTAARAGHGFFLWGSGIGDILFRNCDGHHNANHLWRSGEDQLENQYQHGDGWRIFAGTNIRLVGCRAWHNLDDGYDFTQALDPVEMEDCWAAYSGVDDAAGSITGTPNRPMRRWEGDGIKLGYEDDMVSHLAIRCLSWNNNSHGWTVRGGPYTIYNSAAYNNVEAAFAFIDNNSSNVRSNTYGFQNAVGDGAGAADYSGITVSSSDFVSLDDAGMLDPRGPGGALPMTDFLRPAPGGNLVDVGVDLSLPFEGTAPDIGPFEHTP
jgi:Pel9A-like, right handed beta helix region